MKKLLFLIVSVVMFASCNAQEPKKVSEEAKQFAETAKLTVEQTKSFYEIVNDVDEMAAPLENLVAKYRATEDEATRQAIEKEYDAEEEKLMLYINKVVKENRDNAIPAFFASMLMYEMDYNQLKEFCDESTGYYNNPAMQPAKKLLAGLAKRAPGTKYTDIEENDLQGNPHKLSEWIGKGNYVLVDFWASWCGPCRQEMPNVKAVYDKYHSKGFEIIGLSFDNKQDAWEKAVKDLNLNWVHLSDLKGWQTLAGETYGVMSIPASILVAPDGTIVAEGLRGEALGAKLAEIYGE